MAQHDASPPDWFFDPAQLRGPGPTPVIHNGRVYALSMFSTLKCLDARTGTVIWKRNLLTEYQLPPSSLESGKPIPLPARDRGPVSTWRPADRQCFFLPIKATWCWRS
jgi:outer membrane protein assembly factor BamB